MNGDLNSLALFSITSGQPTPPASDLTTAIEGLVGGKLSTLTRKAYQHDAKLFVNWLAERNLVLDKLIQSDLTHYQAWLVERYTRNTAARKFVVARIVGLYEKGSRAKWLSPTYAPGSVPDLEAGLEVEKENAPTQTEQVSQAELELDFATEAWQKTIRVRRFRKRKYQLDRKLLEICVFSYPAFELRTGDMYVEGSQDFADYRTQLLSWEECQSQVTEYCAKLELPDSPTTLSAALKNWLTEKAKKVDEDLPTKSRLRFE